MLVLVGWLTACMCLAGEDSLGSVPAQPKQPPAADFHFFASLALPLLAALQRPAAQADKLAGEHRKAKRRRTSHDAAADGGQTDRHGRASLAWADVARWAAALPIAEQHSTGQRQAAPHMTVDFLVYLEC